MREICSSSMLNVRIAYRACHNVPLRRKRSVGCVTFEAYSRCRALMSWLRSVCEHARGWGGRRGCSRKGLETESLGIREREGQGVHDSSTCIHEHGDQFVGMHLCAYVYPSCVCVCMPNGAGMHVCTLGALLPEPLPYSLDNSGPRTQQTWAFQT